MPVVRRVISQDEHSDNLWLKLDHNSRFVTNSTEEWQCVFGPNSQPSVASQVLKIAAEYDVQTLNNLRLTAYLYNPNNGTIDAAGTCVFNIHLVQQPNWTEQLITSIPGSVLPNNYFFAQPAESSLAPINLFGGDTIMVEVVVTRLGAVFRDRVYVNHLGIYNNVFRLRQDVEFLDISKVDE